MIILHLCTKSYAPNGATPTEYISLQYGMLVSSCLFLSSLVPHCMHGATKVQNFTKQNNLLPTVTLHYFTAKSSFFHQKIIYLRLKTDCQTEYFF